MSRFTKWICTWNLDEDLVVDWEEIITTYCENNDFIKYMVG